jgi:hypothetical protein
MLFHNKVAIQTKEHYIKTNNLTIPYWVVIYRVLCDEDINYNTSTSTPAAPFPATPDAPPPQAPPPFGPITRARARELNFVMLLKNEGPEE